MAEFETDPDGLTEVGFALSAVADSGPPAHLAGVDGCGSPAVEAAVDEQMSRFGSFWGHATDAVIRLGVGAVTAADAYREVDARVVASSDEAASS